MTGLGLRVIWSDKTSSWVRKPDILSEGLLVITRIIQNIIPNSSRSVEFPMTLLTVTWMQLLNVALRHSKPVLVSTMCWEAVQSSLLFISLDSLHSRLRHSENNITAPLLPDLVQDEAGDWAQESQVCWQTPWPILTICCPNSINPSPAPMSDLGHYQEALPDQNQGSPWRCRWVVWHNINVKCSAPSDMSGWLVWSGERETQPSGVECPESVHRHQPGVNVTCESESATNTITTTPTRWEIQSEQTPLPTSWADTHYLLK